MIMHRYNQYKIQIKQIMKNRTQFRIIYLKNDQSKKPKAGSQPSKSSMIERITHPNNLMPNLVHLSARLQDDVYQDKGMTQRKQMQFIHEEKYLTQSIKKEYKIEKFIQQKQQQIKKQKNSIKNLVGSINFAYNRRKQKKISLIKDKSKNISSSRSLTNQDQANNRHLLEADFNTFLINKQAERTRKMPSIEQIEESKVKKLSVINPQQNEEINSQIFIHSQAKPLNLFHFLSQRSQKQKITKQLKNRKSSSAISAINSRSKVQKNLFNFHTVLKTEQQQFDWSKLKRNEKQYVAKLQ